MGERLRNVVDRRRGNALGREAPLPALRRVVRERPLQRRPQRVLVCAARPVVGETRVGGEVRPVQRPAEALPLALGQAGHQDGAVAHAEGIRRGHARRRGVADRRGKVAGGQVVDQQRREHGQRRLEHRHVQALALARRLLAVERRSTGEGRGDAGGEIDRGEARAHRPRVGMARDRHHARGRLDGAVIGRRAGIGAGLPVARYRTEDEARPDLLQRLVAEAQPVHGAGLEVLHHDVRPGDEAMHHLAGAGMLEVERQRPLAGVDRQEHRRHAGAPEVVVADQVAALVAAGPLLQLDDIGAHHRQVLGAERAGDHLREVDHPHPVERLRHGLSFPLLLRQF